MIRLKYKFLTKIFLVNSDGIFENLMKSYAGWYQYQFHAIIISEVMDV